MAPAPTATAFTPLRAAPLTLGGLLPETAGNSLSVFIASIKMDTSHLQATLELDFNSNSRGAVDSESTRLAWPGLASPRLDTVLVLVLYINFGRAQCLHNVFHVVVVVGFLFVA